MQYKRKIEGRTDYRKRLRLLLSKKPRLVIRRSLNKISAQVIEYTETGDKTLVSTTSKDLVKFGWKASIKNTPASYLTGLLVGKKALEKNIKEVTPDLGLTEPKKGANIFALLKGVKDSGVKISLDEKVLPKESRIKGQHITDYSKNNPNAFKTYKISPEEIPKQFEETKNKIMSQNGRRNKN
ncbi:MAG: 50S ribosomal protein L18 [Nanoarchaeota archaeon]